MRKFLLFLSLAGLFLVAGCSTTGGDDTVSVMKLQNSGEIVAVGETEFDWGDINIMGGAVEKTFTFRNGLQEDLVLKGAQTSCMCTTAQVTLADGTTSPTFEMHQPIPWGGVVKGGEEFRVRVVFDPLAHGPEGTGPVSRMVYLVSSARPDGVLTKQSPQGATTELLLKGNVKKM